MKVSQQQIEEVLILPSQIRYEYFIKTVADWESSWSLYKDGWALAGDESDTLIFPLWPAKEYAELCAVDQWEGYEATEISLEDLVAELIPQLKKDGVLPGVFYTPSDLGVTPSTEQLLQDLEQELENYL